MVIGVPKEVKDHETRVGLVPSGVIHLHEAGHKILVESGAGVGSSITDLEYAQAGAEIVAGARGDYDDARSTLSGALRGLVAGMARRGGLGLVRGTRQPSEEELRPFLLHAERITETLAHLHVARVLGEQAARVPERRGLAERAARRAKLVAKRNAAAIGSGDGGVFAQVDEWTVQRAAKTR